jgi:Uma2 family endonuclease
MNATAIERPATTHSLRMSYDEFLAWEHTGIAEWVNGEVFQISVKDEHQRVVDFLNQLLGFFLTLMKLGVTRSAPYVMRIAPEGPGREPDLMVILNENRHRITSSQLTGPADLIIEVVSDESAARDKLEKFDEYEAAGVREYWLIDSRPNKKRAEFFVLDEVTHRYQPVPVGRDRIYRSTVIRDFWLDTDWLWADAPDAPAALSKILGRAI